LRPLRSRRADRLRRPREWALVRLPHQRSRPPSDPRGPAHRGNREPRGRVRARAGCGGMRRSRAIRAPLRLALSRALAACLLAAGARAQPSPGPTPAAPDGSESASFELGHRAEEVAAQLRQMTESLADESAFAALEQEVAADEHRVALLWDETGRRLAL